MIASVKHLHASAWTGKSVNPHYTVILAVLLGLTAAANSIFHAGAGRTMLYCIGTLLYFFIVFSRYRYRCSGSDYIPSGEGSVAIITVVLVNILITDNIFIVLLLTIPVIALVKGFIMAFAEDRFFSGIVINIILLITLLYIANTHSGFPSERVAGILTGAAHISGHVMGFALLCILLASIIIFLIMLLEPEIALHSHGSSFFSISGIPFRYVRMARTVAAATALAATILCIGLMAGSGLYIYYAIKGRASILEIFLILLLYTQSLVLTAALAGPWIAVCLSLAVSYAMHTAHIIKGINRHA